MNIYIERGTERKTEGERKKEREGGRDINRESKIIIYR